MKKQLLSEKKNIQKQQILTVREEMKRRITNNTV